MMNRVFPVLLAAILSIGCATLRAEESQTEARPLDRQVKGEKSKPVYTIGVTLRKLNAGQRAGQKSYQLLLENGETGKLRILSNAQVLLPNGTPTGIETGLKCDAKYEERGGLVYLDMELHVSALAEPRGQQSGPIPPIQSMQCGVETVLSPGVPTVVSRFDGEKDGESYEVEVKADKVR